MKPFFGMLVLLSLGMTSCGLNIRATVMPLVNGLKPTSLIHMPSWVRMKAATPAQRFPDISVKLSAVSRLLEDGSDSRSPVEIQSGDQLWLGWRPRDSNGAEEFLWKEIMTIRPQDIRNYFVPVPEKVLTLGGDPLHDGQEYLLALELKRGDNILVSSRQAGVFIFDRRAVSAALTPNGFTGDPSKPLNSTQRQERLAIPGVCKFDLDGLKVPPRAGDSVYVTLGGLRVSEKGYLKPGVMDSLGAVQATVVVNTTRLPELNSGNSTGDRVLRWVCESATGQQSSVDLANGVDYTLPRPAFSADSFPILNGSSVSMRGSCGSEGSRLSLVEVQSIDPVLWPAEALTVVPRELDCDADLTFQVSVGVACLGPRVVKSVKKAFRVFFEALDAAGNATVIYSDLDLEPSSCVGTGN